MAENRAYEATLEDEAEDNERPQGAKIPFKDEPKLVNEDSGQLREKADPSRKSGSSSRNSTISKGDARKNYARDDKVSEIDEVLPENVEDQDKEDKKLPPVGILKLFSFSSTTDRLLIALGLVSAIGAGGILPVKFILLGDILTSYVDNTVNQNATTVLCPSESHSSNEPTLSPSNCFEEAQRNSLIQMALIQQQFKEDTNSICLAMTLTGIVFLVLSYLFVTCMNLAAENQVYKMRLAFLKAILKQDIGWFDTHGSESFTSMMTEDLNKIQEGIGEKVGMITTFTSTFVTFMIVALAFGWQLTLVLFSVIPVLSVAWGFMAKAQSSLANNETAAYSKAGKVAEEVLGSLRTVKMFAGQHKELIRYTDNLKFARKAGIKKGMLTGVSGGLTWFLIFCTYALAFWYGIKLIMDDIEECQVGAENCSIKYSPKVMIVVFWSVLMAAFQLGQSSPHVEALSTAKGVATSIFAILERVPTIDSSSKDGLKPKKFEGNIEFQDVEFNYPTRPSVKILQKATFFVKSNTTVALVGASGCGKSTCIQLVQRFYDTLSGGVYVDGVNIKDLNIQWLRKHIGVVSQEPVLFNGTIRENIRHGKDNATDEEIIEACKTANVYNFLSNLPNGLDTDVGEGGTQLSGGQKQRIAIARALIDKPRVLLLDEATSALDNKSEKIVQEALKRASEGRTTIVVSHRLTTIRNADKIIAFKNGVVAEEGTHEELMKLKGIYYNLVVRQTKEDDTSNDDDHSTTRDCNEDESENTEQSKVNFEPSASVVKLVRISNGQVGNDEDSNEKAPSISTWKVLSNAKDDWWAMALGAVGAVLMGGLMPAYGWLFGEVMGIMSHEPSLARRESETYAGVFILVGLVAGIGLFLQSTMFAIAGENLTMRLRKEVFACMLRQELGWHDNPRNNSGALCARLSNDASKVQGAAGTRVGNILQGIFTLIIAFFVSLFFSWKLTFVGCVTIPILIGGVMFQFRLLSGSEAVERKAFEKSATLAVEAIQNIRTVASLCIEDKFAQMYAVQLRGSKSGLASAGTHVRGLLFGFAQASMKFAYALMLYYGSHLIINEGVPYEDVFKVTEILLTSSFLIGQTIALSPDYQKGQVAAANLFQILERKSKIDPDSPSGTYLVEAKGQVDFTAANFAYPTRKSLPVLKNFDLKLREGQHIAIVGHSGCGKSTCVQLILRYYDLDSGSLNVEGNNIKALNVTSLRSIIGVVSQEPVLFDRTIAENIMYGDNEHEVSMSEVMEAAKRANIHSFITKLPSGYDTPVGSKGTQLSGGQKQRIAIARALIRNPKILLLDEATSALDAESEKIVQEALVKAQEDITSITIAHRLTTIKNADMIFTIEGGEIMQAGTHDELIKDKFGLYYDLWNTQTH